jgi:aldose sugar dehydrogenase
MTRTTMLLIGIAVLAVAVWGAGLLAPHRPAGAANAVYASAHHGYRVEVVHAGLEHPWGLAFLPDGQLLVTERPGRLNLIDPREGTRSTVEGLPEVAATGQGGLLDVALHPQFEQTRWVYLSYAAAGDGGYTTHVGRGRLEGAHLTDFERLFVAEPYVSGGRHFGSRLAFDRDGNLLITVGDRGHREHAQDPGNYHGTLVRLTEDGAVPEDNPFVDEGGARPEIYSYGHRNAQGLVLHPTTGEPWLHEHGPRGGDEINRPQPGLNYGWPRTTHGREYHGPRIAPPPPQEGFAPPVHHWTPSIAPSGMAFYDGEAFPRWRGDLFVGALAKRHLRRVRLDGEDVVEEEALLEDLGFRIRDVRSGPDGYLYLLPDERDTAVLRLVPAD